MSAPDEIKGFFGEYRYLSNFWPCEVLWANRIFPSSEHAYMFAKVANPTPDDYEAVVAMTAHEVKKWGRTVELRPDWNERKLQIMSAILLSKFSRNKDLKEKLLDTGEAHIEETNNWGDTYWGVDPSRGGGENWLGKILEAVRRDLRWYSEPQQAYDN